MISIIALIVVLIFILVQVNTRNQKFTDGVPHIIHQVAMSKLQDEDSWPSSWKKCQESWKTHFPDFEYILWNDNAAEELIVTEFPWFYDTYKAYDKDIKRIDAVRYFILYHYGGIYADMDMECKKNFWNQIPQDKISVLENPLPKWIPGKARVQNSLMITPKENPIWMSSFQELEKNRGHQSVLKATGPGLLQQMVDRNPRHFNILKRGEFVQSISLEHNPIIKLSSDENVSVEHHASASWDDGFLNDIYKNIIQ
jgi:hypothetical protein